MPKLALLDSGRCGHVAKLAVALVVKETVAFERGDVDVIAAVVVEVGNGHADAVHLHVQAAARGDVGECSVVIVAIERAVSDLRPRGVQSLLLISRMSGQPSPSASKKAAPEPRVSGRYFLPALPLLCVNWMPACCGYVGEMNRCARAMWPVASAAAYKEFQHKTPRQQCDRDRHRSVSHRPCRAPASELRFHGRESAAARCCLPDSACGASP